MITVFFTSVAFWIYMFGKCRQIMIEAAESKLKAKNQYDATHTIYLDGRPYCGAAVISRSNKRVDKGLSLQGIWNNRLFQKLGLSNMAGHKQALEVQQKVAGVEQAA